MHRFTSVSEYIYLTTKEIYLLYFQNKEVPNSSIFSESISGALESTIQPYFFSIIKVEQ